MKYVRKYKVLSIFSNPFILETLLVTSETLVCAYLKFVPSELRN